MEVCGEDKTVKILDSEVKARYCVATGSAYFLYRYFADRLFVYRLHREKHEYRDYVAGKTTTTYRTWGEPIFCVKPLLRDRRNNLGVVDGNMLYVLRLSKAVEKVVEFLAEFGVTDGCSDDVVERASIGATVAKYAPEDWRLALVLRNAPMLIIKQEI